MGIYIQNNACQLSARGSTKGTSTQRATAPVGPSSSTAGFVSWHRRKTSTTARGLHTTKRHRMPTMTNVPPRTRSGDGQESGSDLGLWPAHVPGSVSRTVLLSLFVMRNERLKGRTNANTPAHTRPYRGGYQVWTWIKRASVHPPLYIDSTDPLQHAPSAVHRC
jgi:hypothetical protein